MPAVCNWISCNASHRLPTPRPACMSSFTRLFSHMNHHSSKYMSLNLLPLKQSQYQYCQTSIFTFFPKKSPRFYSNKFDSTACVKPTSSSSSSVDEKKSWIDKYLPEEVLPYARLARIDLPVGIWLVGLLTWPFMWSITLATPQGHLPDFKTLILFICGVYPFRCATMIINDILDYDIDRKVERTKSRPIASDVITRFQGLCFFGFQITLGLGILFPVLNNLSRLLGIPFLFLMCTYPLKRTTYWPQAYLGLNFSWGALLGWAAVKGSLDMEALCIVFPLYMGGVFWTLVYETIYGHQDREEDIKVGVKSAPVLLGDSSKKWMTGFAIACISSLVLCGYNAQIGWAYYVFLIAAFGQLGWQIWTVNLLSAADCKSKFSTNKWFGAIVFCGILSGRILP